MVTVTLQSSPLSDWIRSIWSLVAGTLNPTRRVAPLGSLTFLVLTILAPPPWNQTAFTMSIVPMLPVLVSVASAMNRNPCEVFSVSQRPFQ